MTIGDGAYTAAGSVVTDDVPPGAMDSDPTHDEVILDFDDSLSDAAIKGLMGQHGLEVSLNSVHSDAPNIYIARVAEGASPYVRSCLLKSLPAGTLEGVEENFEYNLWQDQLPQADAPWPDAPAPADAAVRRSPLSRQS